MAMKMKGIYKGFKCISQIFDVKERKMEIGFPTDVKHVAHIGWDGSSGSAPTWMSEFKGGAELLSPRMSSFGNARHSNSFFSSASSSDFDRTSKQPKMASGASREIPSANIPNVGSAAKKKNRKMKSASSGSSPKSISSTRSSRSLMSKSTYKSTTSR